MICNRDFIVFSDDWGRYPFSCQHIMQNFLPGNRLLWVNTIGMRNPTLSFRDLKRSIEKVGSWLKTETVHKDLPANLHILNPHMLPFSNSATIRRFNKKSVLRTAFNYSKTIGLSNPILITTLPITADYLGAFDEELSIYYCVDDYAEMPGNNRELMQQLEAELLRRADLVCASAASLVVKTTTEKHVPLLLPHGVDTNHFTCRDQADVPNTVQPPTVGFFGAISPWLDLNLLQELATARSDWNFVFIGPIDADISSLERLPNVIFRGKIDYEMLPAAVQNFDVALIPFKINPLTISVNPLKLMEYLALGLPVVSTFLPEVERHSDLVLLAKDAEEFAEKIKKALMSNTGPLRQKRVERAQGYSWQAVSEKFSDFIESRLSDC